MNHPRKLKTLNKAISAVHFSLVYHFVENIAITRYINQTESTLKKLPQLVIDVLLEKVLCLLSIRWL